jgi:drug/metabolite transporter (DMT)-like permease
VRRLTAREDPRVIVFYFPLIATALALPWALGDFVVPDLSQLAALLGIGVTTQLGQLWLTRGLALERAGTATAVGYVQVAFAMSWGLLLFEEPLVTTTVAGVTMIGLSLLAIALSRQASPAPP